MNKVLTFFLILTMGINIACVNQTDDETESLEGAISSDTTCSYTLIETIYLDKALPSYNFLELEDDINVVKTISNSSCEYYPDSNTIDSYKWVSRIGDFFTFAKDDPILGDSKVHELYITNNVIQENLTSSCNSYNEKVESKLFTFKVDNSLQKITLTYFYDVKASSCNEYDGNLYIQETPLNGTGTTSCNEGIVEKLSHYKNAMERKRSFFDSDDCSGTELVQIVDSGTFKIGNFVYSNFLASNEINYNYQKFTINLLAAATVTAFNNSLICGKSDWQLNSNEVTGLQCALASVVPAAKYENFSGAYQDIYDIFHIDQNNKLYFGQKGVDTNKTSTSDRSKILETQEHFTINPYDIVMPSWFETL